MKTAYLDCFAGISGDMMIGALLDLGLALSDLEAELKKIDLPEYELESENVSKLHVSATRFIVRTDEKGLVRTWPNIKELIEGSGLEKGVKTRALDIFLRLAQAEAKIHRKALDQVHFHEVGAVDAIIDVVGTAYGVARLGIEEVVASPVATGFGLIKTEHGLMPVPSPAAVEILTGATVYSANVPAELVTPTGAAILMSYASSFGEMPPLKIEGIGYGAGTRELEIPNVLRIVVGERLPVIETDEVTLVDVNLDDTTPETLGYVLDRLMRAGALDAWFTPAFMKKNRPATILSVLVPVEVEEDVINIIFTETTALGLRFQRQRRRIIERETVEVETGFGKARAKIGRLGGRIVSISPEYEDCRRLAHESGRPLKEIYRLVVEAARAAGAEPMKPSTDEPPA